MEKNNRSPIVEVIGATLGIFMVVAVLFLIFSKENVGVLVPVSWAFMVLGIIGVIFQYKALVDDKKKK